MDLTLKEQGIEPVLLSLNAAAEFLGLSRCALIQGKPLCFPCPLWVISRHVQCKQACPL
jgi:hypothetical protein